MKIITEYDKPDCNYTLCSQNIQAAGDPSPISQGKENIIPVFPNTNETRITFWS